MQNPQINSAGKSQLKKVYASVTMVDVSHGDCYVVDLLLNSKDPENAESWNRFVIDTGPKLQGVPARIDAVTGAVYGDPNLISPQPPWSTTYPENIELQDRARPILPPLAGIIITHSDDDHWGNSAPLLNKLKSLGRARSPLHNNDSEAVRVYTPPMIEWTKQVAKFDNGTGGLMASEPEVMSTFDYAWDSDLMLSYYAKPKARSINRSFTHLDELAMQTGYRVLFRFNIVNEAVKDAIWQDPRCRYTEVPETYLKDGCLTKDKNFNILTQYIIQSVYRSDLESSESYFVLAEITLMPPKVKPSNVKTSKAKFSNSDDGLAKNLAEITLMPPKVKPSNPDDGLAKNVSGYWARRFISIDRDSMSVQTRANANANFSPLYALTGQASRQRTLNEVRKMKSASIGGNPNIIPTFKPLAEYDPFDTEVGDGLDWILHGVDKTTFMIPPEQQRSEIPTKNGRKKLKTGDVSVISTGPLKKRINEADIPSDFFKPEFVAVGLTDDVYRPEFIHRWSSQEIGNYETSYYGVAGSVYARDFQGLAMQYYLSDRTIDMPQAPKPMEEEEDEEVVTQPTEVQQTKNKKKERPRCWAEYANRSSIINYWIYREPHGEYVDMVTNKEEAKKDDEALVKSEEFTMLFTGDAFELGQGETGYSPYNKIRGPVAQPKYDFENGNIFLNSQFGRTTDIEGFRAKPEGNLLNWMYRNHNLLSKRVDVLKIPHHGSSTTTNALFYRLVTASIYLISASSNRHRHPRPETMETIIGAILHEDGAARAPKEFKSQDDQASGKDPILWRKQPRLFFITHEVENNGNKIVEEGKEVPDLNTFLTTHGALHANLKEEPHRSRVNARFMYQKKPHAKTRLNFGRDAYERLRVEWHEADWEEIRPDFKDGRDSVDDPVAYPRPFTDPDWNRPSSSTNDEEMSW